MLVNNIKEFYTHNNFSRNVIKSHHYAYLIAVLKTANKFDI